MGLVHNMLYNCCFSWKGNITFFCENLCSSRISFKLLLVIDVLTDVLWFIDVEMLYTDDLAFCGESLDKVMGKYTKWKSVLEERV